MDEQPALPGVVDGSLRKRIYAEITAGIEARARGEAIETNPHPVGTYYWSLWRDGWRSDLM